MFKKSAFYFFFFLLTSLPLRGFAAQNEHLIIQVTKGAPYIFCFDGGGSKTALQILDAQGNTLPLFKEGQELSTLQGACSNLVVVDKAQVQKVFNGFIDNLFVGKEKRAAKDLIKDSAFVGGFAGLAREETLSVMKEIVQEMGFSENRTALYTDAGLALELTGDAGAILIGGTGSICFVRENDEIKRVGGLGYRIGDAGSGYWIGLQAIKLALEEEYGYGLATGLTPIIRDYFEVKQCKELVSKINGNQIPPDQVASLAPYVFEQAWKGDEIAYGIVEQAAHELGDLLASGVSQTQLKHCMTYLLGGLFQDTQANKFLSLLFHSPKLQKLPPEKRPLLVNISDKMFPVLVTQEKLRLQKEPDKEFFSSLPIIEHPVVEEDSTCNPEFKSQDKQDLYTLKMSRLFFKDSYKALYQSHQEDTEQLKTLTPLIEKQYVSVAQAIVDQLSKGGRVFLVAKGMHAHLANDLATKWQLAFSDQNSLYQNQVIPLFDLNLNEISISNDFRLKAIKAKLSELNPNSNDAFVLLTPVSKEFLEDFSLRELVEEGALCYAPLLSNHLENLKVNSSDLLKLNSICISSYNQLKESNIEFFWGNILNEAFDYLTKKNNEITIQRGLNQLRAVTSVYHQIENKLQKVNELVKLQIKTVSEQEGNVWNAFEESFPTYVAFMASSGYVQNPLEVGIDHLPCYSDYLTYLSPDCCNGEDRFNAFLVGQNLQLRHLSGSSSTKESQQGTLLGDYILSAAPQTSKRSSLGHKKLFTAFGTSADQKDCLASLFKETEKLKKGGVQTALILSEIQGSSFDKKFLKRFAKPDFLLSFKNVPNDSLKITHALLMKQFFSLLSRGTFNGINKIYGHMKIDLLPVENEVVERNIALIQNMYQEVHGTSCPYGHEDLALLVRRVFKYKSLAEEQLGDHVPTPSKLSFTMLEKKCPIEEAVTSLEFDNENIKLMLSRF